MAFKNMSQYIHNLVQFLPFVGGTNVKALGVIYFSFIRSDPEVVHWLLFICILPRILMFMSVDSMRSIVDLVVILMD